MKEFKLVGHLSKEPRLQNKVCVVTGKRKQILFHWYSYDNLDSILGANRGFVQAIAIRFAEEGICMP